MTVIKLKTDGERYRQLVEKHESQMEALVPFEEERDKTNEASRRALWDVMRAEEEDSAEAERRRGRRRRRRARTRLKRPIRRHADAAET